jgi:hypothetical protein
MAFKELGIQASKRQQKAGSKSEGKTLAIATG